MPTTKNRAAERPKSTEIISHWPKLIQDFQFSSSEFYCRVEKLLCERQVPHLEASRVDWKEGGPLSARREYLRLERQRLVFDICAAPFGTGFFVSIWFGEKKLRIGLMGWILTFLGVFLVFELVTWIISTIYRTVVFGVGSSDIVAALVLVCVLLAALWSAAAFLGPGLDDFIISVPLVGHLYERFFRKITFYRVDQTCMYQSAVHAAVTQVIEEITKPQGIQPLSESDRQPTMKAFLQSQGSNGHG